MTYDLNSLEEEKRHHKCKKCCCCCPGPDGDTGPTGPEGPTGPAGEGCSCIFNGELVENPSFEQNCPASGEGTPCYVFAYWNGTNIAKGTKGSEAPLTGESTAVLGAINKDNAKLTQIISGITPGCYYNFSFSVNAQNLANNAGSKFKAQVYWQKTFTPSSSDIPAIDNSINPILIDNRFSGNNYVFIFRVLNAAPADTLYARIEFTKEGNGSVLVDDVSLTK